MATATAVAKSASESIRPASNLCDNFFEFLLPGFCPLPLLPPCRDFSESVLERLSVISFWWSLGNKLSLPVACNAQFVFMFGVLGESAGPNVLLGVF